MRSTHQEVSASRGAILRPAPQPDPQPVSHPAHGPDGERRFSDFEKRIDGISQKMLAQQVRQLEADGIVERTVHAAVPPRVDYRMTAWGQGLCPALDAILKWGEARGT